MTAAARRRLLIPALLVMLSLLAGCGNSYELNEMFLITGIALDKSDQDGLVDVAMQAALTGGEGSNTGESGEGSGSGGGSLVLKGTQHTVAGAIQAVNNSSSRKVFIHHNQAILLGEQLAREGFEKHIDLFLRDTESRMEVPVLVIEDRAVKALEVELDQDKISAMFISHLLDGLGDTSRFFEVRMLDVVSMLLDETSSPVLPKLSVIDTDETKALHFSGMAVFKHDKYIADLVDDEVLGYIWAMGDVKNSAMLATCDLGLAAFSITALDCKRTVTLDEGGGVSVAFDIHADLTLRDLVGFDDLSTEELMPHLKRISQDEILNTVVKTFEIARGLNADIYEFGSDIHRKYPARWRDMKDNWDEIFPSIALTARVTTNVRSTGKVTQSIGMKETQND